MDWIPRHVEVPRQTPRARGGSQHLLPAATSLLLMAALLGLPVDGRAQDEVSRAGDATRWSVLATLLPMAAGVAVATGDGGTGQTITSASLLWGGAIVGPATGYLHGGVSNRAIPGLFIRGAAFIAAAVASPTSDMDDGFYPNPSLDEEGVWVLASAVILATAAVDMLSVGGIVRDAEAARVSVLPHVDPGHRAFGLVAVARW